MDTDHPQIHEIMQFRVAEEASQPDTSAAPADLSLPHRSGPNPEAARETREITMEMVMPGMDDDGEMDHGEMDDEEMDHSETDDGDHGDEDDDGMDHGEMDDGEHEMEMDEPMLHTLNGKRWGDPIEIKPQLGSTEIWELVNEDEHTHPIHLHLVEFEVIERERHDSDHGPRPPLPNERGGKDVVRVDPGETVRIAVKFDGFAGKYPFHCHILEHEEHDMMRPFEVVKGASDDAGRDTDGREKSDQGRGRGRGQGRGNGKGKGR